MPIRVLWLALPVLLGACGNPFAGYAPNHGEIVSQAWVRPELAYVPPPLYCYATLAEPECHAASQPGQDQRLIGHYGGEVGPLPR